VFPGVGHGLGGTDKQSLSVAPVLPLVRRAINVPTQAWARQPLPGNAPVGDPRRMASRGEEFFGEGGGDEGVALGVGMAVVEDE
jgi:hypothetical protein